MRCARNRIKVFNSAIVSRERERERECTALREEARERLTERARAKRLTAKNFLKFIEASQHQPR